MKNIIELILFLSDSITIVLNNLVSLVVYPINLLANILYGIGERCGLIEPEPNELDVPEQTESNSIGFKIMSDKTKVNE